MADEAQAGDTLRAELADLRALFQQAPGYMAVLRGPEHVFALVNDASRRTVGDRDLIGQPVRKAMPELAGQGFLELLDEVRATGRPFVGHQMPMTLQRSPVDPVEQIFLDFVYQPIIESDGKVSGVFVQGSDVTERCLAEQELRDSGRRKDEFLAMLAHELRNPLAPITAGAQLLRLVAPGNEQVQLASEVIERQARHMTALVDDLMDASRFSRGQAPLERSAQDLGQLLEQALEQVRPAIQAKGHALRVHAPADPLPLQADPRRLVQAIANLLSNAAKFTPAGGCIDVELGRESSVWAEPALRLVVRDNGIGIDPTMQPRIFELFSQGSRSLERSEGGLGIGLALVRAIVSGHGGRVEVDSAGDGQGSSFTLFLPPS